MEKDGTHHNDVKELIEKYFNNSCSKEELKEILRLAQEGSDELLDALKLQWSKAEEYSLSNENHWNGLFDTMMITAKQTELDSSTKLAAPGESRVISIGNRRRRLMIRLTAVAAILLVVVTTIFFLYSKENREFTQQTTETPVENDIAPGGDKAVLTLANGKTIILDTASNGALAKQGGIQVIKINGQLSYDGESDSKEVLYNTITTPKGGQYQLELADGTQVWLNAASSLRFPTAFKGKDRTVELTGEGYFEVAHNTKMPFHVTVNEMEVAVLGTHFNINSYDDEPTVKTTLLEGRVMVKQAGKFVYLNPGQQATIAEGSSSVRVVNDVDVDEVIAWKNGLIQFSGADLGMVMRNISRWYNIEVSYSNVESAHLSGKVSRNLNLSQVIKVLEESGIDIKMEGKKLTATPRP